MSQPSSIVRATEAYQLFAVSRPVAEMTADLQKRTKADVASELLGFVVPDDEIELFAVADLAGVGLSGYLIEGQGIPADDIAPDRAKLEALDGYVLLLLPNALAEDASLPSVSKLTLIGTYQEAKPELDMEPIETASANPYSGTPRLTPAHPPKGRAGSAMTILAIIIAAILVLWWWLA